jgi:hypothetical protein
MSGDHKAHQNDLSEQAGMDFYDGQGKLLFSLPRKSVAQWHGLPDMLVYDLADTHLYGGKNYGILSFYKAIEQALKEKNT